jgi:hypothetical protein
MSEYHLEKTTGLKEDEPCKSCDRHQTEWPRSISEIFNDLLEASKDLDRVASQLDRMSGSVPEGAMTPEEHRALKRAEKKKGAKRGGRKDSNRTFGGKGRRPPKRS